MAWGFAESIAFAAAMTIHEMHTEKQHRLFKTQKFYQKCYEEIADYSSKAMDIVFNVSKKASPCYIPKEIGTGVEYLPLYAFSKIISMQGIVTSEQSKIVKIFFDNIHFPFSQYECRDYQYISQKQ